MATKKTPAKPAVPDELKQLARTHYLENAAMNAAKRRSDAARKELFSAMITQNLKPFAFATTDAEGKELKLDVKLGQFGSVEMDVRKLRELVPDDETFLRIVSATKKAVEDLAGKDVAVLCEVKMAGALNVSVKPSA